MKLYQGYLNGVTEEQIALINSKLFIYWRWISYRWEHWEISRK